MTNCNFFSVETGKLAVEYISEKTTDVGYAIPEKKEAYIHLTSEGDLTPEEREEFIKVHIAQIDNLPRETEKLLPIKPEKVHYTSKVDKRYAPDPFYLFLKMVQPNIDEALKIRKLKRWVYPTNNPSFFVQVVPKGTEYSIDIEKYLEEHKPKPLFEDEPIKVPQKKVGKKVAV